MSPPRGETSDKDSPDGTDSRAQARASDQEDADAAAGAAVLEGLRYSGKRPQKRKRPALLVRRRAQQWAARGILLRALAAPRGSRRAGMRQGGWTALA